MSQQAIPTPVDCCSPCIPSGTSSAPGPQGPAGANGTNGTDGQSAFTTATNGFTMPAFGGTTASLEVGNSDWLAAGEMVFTQSGGVTAYMVVASVPDSTHITLTNPSTGAAADDEYADNAAPTTVFGAGTKIVAGGVQGPGAGAITPGTYFEVANDLSEGDPATMRTNIGLGTVSVLDEGTGDGEVPIVNDAAGLTNGEALFATATGIESVTASAARIALGLTTGVSSGNVVTADGNLTDGEAVFATATGIESLPVADAQLALALYATNNGRLALHQNIDLNTVGDTVFPVIAAGAGAGGNFVIDTVVLYNPSINITTAQVAVFTAAGGGGTTLAAAQAVTGLSAAGKFVELTLAAVCGTDYFVTGTVPDLYIRVTTPQGAAAICAAVIFGRVFDN